MFIYPIDEFIIEVMTAIYTDKKYFTYREIIDTLYKLRLTYLNKNDIDIETFELGLKDIICKLDEENDTKVLKLDIYIRDTVIEYVKKYGIVLDIDVRPSQMADILNALYVIYNIEPELIDAIQMQLEDIEEDDNSIRMCNFLSNYTKSKAIELYDIIIDVREDTIEELYRFLEKKKVTNVKETTTLVYKLLTTLSSNDINYNNTAIVRNIVSNGYNNSTLDILLTDMYSTLEFNSDYLSNIAYEIVATLYIASDTREDLLTAYKEFINLDIVSFLYDNDKAKEFVNSSVIDLIEKLKG